MGYRKIMYESFGIRFELSSYNHQLCKNLELLNAPDLLRFVQIFNWNITVKFHLTTWKF